jgi:methionyl-tRNA formyltransferase
MSASKLKFVYFGGEPLGVPVLEALKSAGYVPGLVVASPDRPVGRKHVLTPPPVKVWAEANQIPVIQPESFPTNPITPTTNEPTDSPTAGLGALVENEWDLFIVVAYNHILPSWLINLPTHKTLNVHPSLLPLLRGASPIRSAILRDMREELGVSIMLLDHKMDHGPVITQKRLAIAAENWPMRGPELDAELATLGGKLLVAALPAYCAGELIPQAQEHEYATYCGKFDKTDSQLTLDPHHLPTGPEAVATLRTVYALMGGPDTYFIHNDQRLKILDAQLSPDGTLMITKVTPAGKGPQLFSDWLAQQNK